MSHTNQGALSHQDLLWISEQLYVQAVIGTLSVSDDDVIISGEDYNVTVSSVLGDFQTVQKFTVLQGETFDFKDVGYQEQKLVATSDLEEKVMEDTGKSLLNQYISVGVNGMRL